MKYVRILSIVSFIGSIFLSLMFWGAIVFEKNVPLDIIGLLWYVGLVGTPVLIIISIVSAAVSKSKDVLKSAALASSIHFLIALFGFLNATGYDGLGYGAMMGFFGFLFVITVALESFVNKFLNQESAITKSNAIGIPFTKAVAVLCISFAVVVEIFHFLIFPYVLKYIIGPILVALKFADERMIEYPSYSFSETAELSVMVFWFLFFYLCLRVAYKKFNLNETALYTFFYFATTAILFLLEYL